jgi:hypothetical protein
MGATGSGGTGIEVWPERVGHHRGGRPRGRVVDNRFYRPVARCRPLAGARSALPRCPCCPLPLPPLPTCHRTGPAGPGGACGAATGPAARRGLWRCAPHWRRRPGRDRRRGPQRAGRRRPRPQARRRRRLCGPTRSAAVRTSKRWPKAGSSSAAASCSSRPIVSPMNRSRTSPGRAGRCASAPRRDTFPGPSCNCSSAGSKAGSWSRSSS